MYLPQIPVLDVGIFWVSCKSFCWRSWWWKWSFTRSSCWRFFWWVELHCRFFAKNNDKIILEVTLRTSMGQSLWSLIPVNLKLFFIPFKFDTGKSQQFITISSIIFQNIKITFKVAHVTCMQVRHFWRVLVLLVKDDVTGSFFKTGNLFGSFSIQTSDNWTIGEYRNQHRFVECKSCICCELSWYL